MIIVMKRLLMMAVMLTMSIFSFSAKSQVSVNINIGSQPLWGPVGYDHVDYYYLPDIDMYYYVPSAQYIYFNNGRWVWVKNLPVAYRNYDFYNAYKVVLNTPRPYLNHRQNVVQYAKFKNYKTKQVVIRDSRDSRYSVVRGHANYKANNVRANQPSVGKGREQQRREAPRANDKHNNRGNERGDKGKGQPSHGNGHRG